ncbi:MAG TPA: hypothetical protein VMF65_10015 [Acidimicrobiales bacterium]|nr:hypothetical protein [Acidimicrobiales bacterium]
MHDALLLASISKHDIGGIVFVVIAVALIAWGVIKIMAKAAGAVLWTLLGLLAAIVAILLFTRAV